MTLYCTDPGVEREEMGWAQSHCELEAQPETSAKHAAVAWRIVQENVIIFFRIRHMAANFATLI